MPLLSDFARKKKIKYFLEDIPKNAKVLEVGSGSGWAGNYLKKNGWKNYIGIDINPPADIVGNIKNWKELGLKAETFDVIIAFEVVEHVDCFEECKNLLKPNGVLMVTTPLPEMDWLMKILELIGLNQKRTSPHNNLIHLNQVSGFSDKNIKLIGFVSQWGKLKK